MNTNQELLSWPTRPLSNCGVWVSGGTPSKSTPSYWNGSIPWISAKSLKCFELYDSEDRISDAAVSNGAMLVPKGTVLFVVRGMSLAKEFRVGVTGRSVAFNQDLRGIIPSEDIDGRYLARFLASSEQRICGLVSDASHGTKRLPTEIIEALSVPVPSLDEQRRIAYILDEADALRRKRSEAIRLVDTLSSSLFIDQVGDPIRNPKKWRMSTFGEELADLEYGPRFYNENYTPAGVRIVRITDLDVAGNLDFESMPRLEVEPSVKAARCLKPGDIILARSGATVGKSALIKEGAPECIAGAYFIRLQFKDTVRPQYVKMLLDTKPIQAIIAQRSVQSAQQNFSGPGIRALPLPVPPKEIQLGVEAAMAERQATLAKMISHRAELDNLFHSLLQRAFRGEL